MSGAIVGCFALAVVSALIVILFTLFVLNDKFYWDEYRCIDGGVESRTVVLEVAVSDWKVMENHECITVPTGPVPIVTATPTP